MLGQKVSTEDTGCEQRYIHHISSRCAKSTWNRNFDSDECFHSKFPHEANGKRNHRLSRRKYQKSTIVYKGYISRCFTNLQIRHLCISLNVVYQLSDGLSITLIDKIEYLEATLI